ncbi:MAG: hypothetical protein BGO82_14190 [Devosia sp. 67-54]|nr:MAG: hypothetical protein BGO82_14190 [Devosia sp. 67-54]
MSGCVRIMHLDATSADLASRSSLLTAEMPRLDSQAMGIDGSDLVERRALELMVNRFLAEVRQSDYQIASDPVFWPAWMSFCNVNQPLETAVFPPQRRNVHAGFALPRSRDLDPVVMALRTGKGLEDVQLSDPLVPERERPTISAASAHAFCLFAGSETAGDDKQPRVSSIEPTFVLEGGAPAQSNDTGLPALAAASFLSQVLCEYLKQARIRAGTNSAENDVGLILRFVVDLIGDVRMCDLTPGHFVTIENVLPDIPHPSAIPAEHSTSLHARYCYAQRQGWEKLRRLSRARITNTYHRCLHAFFRWAADHGAYEGKLPRFKLVAKGNRRDQKRDAWRADEIVKLFSLPLFTGSHSRARHWKAGDRLIQNEIYWAFLLIFFMGVRPSEIGRTRTEDVTFIDGHWYLDYRNKSPDAEGEEQVKAEASARLVPIHPLLLDLGLLDRHADLVRAGTKMLFPEWKRYRRRSTGEIMWGHTFSKAWQYVRATFAFERQDLTVYGGRHTRATWYDEAKLPKRIRIRALGHKASDVADSYGAQHLTRTETELVLSVTNSVETKVADILLTAKLRAMEGELVVIKTW